MGETSRASSWPRIVIVSIAIAIAWRSDWSYSFHCWITGSARTIGGSYTLETLGMARLTLFLKSIIVSARSTWTTGPRGKTNGQITTETLSGQNTRTSLAGIMAEFANACNINITIDTWTRIVQ